MRSVYHPARVIRSPFGNSLGIEMSSYPTVEEALAEGKRKATCHDDWNDNWTVVVESEHDRYVSVPEEIVSYMKGGF